MHFYKHPTGGPSYLVLHKNEWSKLKKKAKPPEIFAKQDNEYLKGLIEQSQAWVRNWPDTVQGHVAQVKKQRVKQRSKDIAMVKAFAAKKARNNTAEAIEKARQKIFEDSCYGRKLLAAFRESKTLEERDVQVEYLKKHKREVEELEQKKLKQELLKECCSFGLDKNQTVIERERKERAIKFAQINKDKHERQKENLAKTNEKEKFDMREDVRLTKELLLREKEAEEKTKLLERQMMAEYEIQHNSIKAEKEIRKVKYEEAIEECKKDKDKLQLKIKRVLKQMYDNRVNSTQTKHIYELVEKCQQEEKNLYENFIRKYINEEEERISQKEKYDKETKQAQEKLRLTAQSNKAVAETKKQIVRSAINKCSDRQCVLPNSRKERMKITNDVDTMGNVSTDFGPCNKLMAALKRREKESSSYTGACAAHQQFAKEADVTLRDCKYKMAGRKVVDEYRKFNGLDATTLPVPNY